MGRRPRRQRPLSADESTPGGGGENAPAGLGRHEIAAALRELGGYLRLGGENPYRARAYERAAASVEALGDRFEPLLAEGRLTDAPGIGASIAAVISELAETGQSRQLEKLRGDLPPGLLELQELPGLTLPRIRAIHGALGVNDLDDLRRVVAEGKLASVKGFGPKTAEKIREAIEKHDTRPARVLLVDALVTGRQLLEYVTSVAEVTEASLAGSIRRWEETVGTIRVVAAAPRPEVVIERVLRWGAIVRTEARDGGHLRARLSDGTPIEVDVVSPSAYAATLLARTGSEAHMRRLAARGVPLVGETEAAIYARLGLPAIPPELREDAGEIEAAERGDDFSDLVTIDDLRGLTHCHTTYSDGKATVEEMARAADAMGMKYLTITDHSPTASYAGGVDLDRLARQWDEIAAVQEKVKVKLLRGTESDILADGALDYPDRVLEQMDVVIASIHNRNKMGRSEMTERLVRAMRQPVFKIWGHALGRLVLRRDPIDCDVEAVLDVIAASPAAVEVNGDPYRLDMEPRWIREARKRGIKFIISTDAHSVGDLHNLPFGIGIARRGGVRRGEVLNALPLDAFQRAVKPAR